MSGWIGSQGTKLAGRVVARWGAECHLCHEPIDLTLPRTHKRGLTIDHIIPRARLRHLPAAARRAFERDVHYLRPAHYSCNSARQDKPHRARAGYLDPSFFPSSGQPGDPAGSSLSRDPGKSGNA